MSTTKEFLVNVVGEMTEREWQILATATRLTTSRARSYIFEVPSKRVPDIYLVDGDSPETVRLWRSLHALHAAPTIFMKLDALPSSGSREFRHPLVPSCLLSLVNLLDEVTVEDLHYLPELYIGQEGNEPDTNLTVKASKGKSYSALVVDDSSTVRAQVALGLKMFGATADFAETAEEAFTMLAKKSYDIAFLDVVLPGADGYQVCKAIKKGKITSTIVVMLTGKSSTFDRVKASLAGCDTFLTKPVQNEVFQQTLRKYLGGNSAVPEGTPRAVAAK